MQEDFINSLEKVLTLILYLIHVTLINSKKKWPVILQHQPENDVYKDCCKNVIIIYLAQL